MNNSKQQTQDVQGQERKILPTEIAARAYPVSGDGPTLANITFDLNGCFAIRGAKLVQGQNGPFVSMPQRRTKEGYQEVVFPVTKEMREMVNDMAVAAYNMAMENLSQKEESVNRAAPTEQNMSM